MITYVCECIKLEITNRKSKLKEKKKAKNRRRNPHKLTLRCEIVNTSAAHETRNNKIILKETGAIVQAEARAMVAMIAVAVAVEAAAALNFIHWQYANAKENISKSNVE